MLINMFKKLSSIGMRLPCEYVVKEFLPAIRYSVSMKLSREHGWRNKEIAEALDVTPAVISKYLDRSYSPPSNVSRELVDELAKDVVGWVLRGRDDPRWFIRRVCAACMEQRIEGEICRIHRADLAYLSDCRACAEMFFKMGGISGERLEVIRDLDEAYAMLRRIEGIERLIPEVRTNIVEGIQGAKDIRDVAGFPGRITLVNGMPTAYGRPRFGGSHHMAEVLLAMMDVDSRVKAATCIKYFGGILEAADKLSLRYEKIDREEYPDLLSFIRMLDTAPDLLVDLGGRGIEPVVYVFGRKAQEAVEKVKGIASIMV